MTEPLAPVIHTVNPATGERIRDYDYLTPDALDGALDGAAAAALAWAATTVEQRCTAVGALARGLRERRAELARLASLEMGKPLREAEGEVDKCAWAAEWFAEAAPGLLAGRTVDLGGSGGSGRATVTPGPLGVVLAIMPWNFPYWQVVRAAVPALCAGNAVVCKPAAITTGCAVALAEVVADAGFPRGAFQVALIPDAGLGAVIADPRIAGVTLTGSTGAGRSVAEHAGRALKKTVLELGGSDPFVVLDDADLPRAAAQVVASRFQNAGQSCIAAKRLIVSAEVAEELTDLVLAEVAKLRVGDPLDPETRMGPLARADLREVVARQVEATVDRGATLRCGGHTLDGPGFFYAPTVLTDLEPEATVLTDEVFGPVLPIVPVADDAEAVRVANSTRFGLGGAVWTADPDRAARVAAGLASGQVAVNGITASDPRIPFGGTRDSGIGRELSLEGIREFTNLKTVVWADA